MIGVRKLATEAAIQKLLNRIATDSVKAEEMAKTLYGPEGFIFAEAEGTLSAMAGDCYGTAQARQKFVRLSAKSYHRLGVGAW